MILFFEYSSTFNFSDDKFKYFQFFSKHKSAIYLTMVVS